jgi:hypothetical protein
LNHRGQVHDHCGKKDANWLEVFEMLVWRKIHKVKWTEHKTNGEVLKDGGRKEITDENNTVKTEKLGGTHTEK